MQTDDGSPCSTNPRRDNARPAIRRKVLLVDDPGLIRIGTRALLDSLPRPPCETFEAASLDEALSICSAEAGIDLILLDLNLCDAKGLQGLRALQARAPGVPVAVMSGTADEAVVRQAQALGAVGYLLKSWAPDRICSALNSLLAARRIVPAASSAQSAARFPRLAGSRAYDRVAELGTRHLQVLELIISGCTNVEISSVTGLASSTVKNDVSAVLLALDVKSRAHLISLFH